jgi:hypothetical protein
VIIDVMAANYESFWKPTGIPTPTGSKRKGDERRTPTPDNENRGGSRVRRMAFSDGKGGPIAMQGLNDESPERTLNGAKDPTKGGARINIIETPTPAMAKQQEDAMKLAPPWAKVILSVLRETFKP